MDVPRHLIDQVAEGRVVLCLGSGASKGARNPDGSEAPTGPQLARLLADKFLDGGYEHYPLDTIGELACSVSDRITVQTFIRSKFINLRPASFHLLLPSFRWRALATTNYDLVVERSYDEAPAKIQQIVPFVTNRDRVDDLLRTPDSLALIKLHGSISRIDDHETPLILTPDQYVMHRQGRDRLFGLLRDLATEYPIVFVGQSLHDPDLRQLLLELTALGDQRPRYYLVTPQATPAEVDMWGSRRVTVLQGRYEDFLATLDSSLLPQLRRLDLGTASDHPISRRFTVPDGRLTEATKNFLTYEAEYVHPGLLTEPLRPQEFYKGVSGSWTPIELNLDARRTLVDTILEEVVIADETDHPSVVDFYWVRAEAGAGKSVVLRRVAWDASSDYNRLCIFIGPSSRIEYDSVREISELTGERIYLFVDNAADHVRALEFVVGHARRDRLKLTVITTERANEWNMACERLQPFVSREYDLRRLDSKEIAVLVHLLERHNSLGNLARASFDERVRAFEELADRQLLVALHEATQGRRFEDILVDEFEAIQPQAARTLYRTVCVLNRLGVPVRAGLISRVHGIPFDEFRERLFGPLEHVVMVTRDRATGDYSYVTRHPLVAQIVFERIIARPEDRYDEYVRLLGAMNIAYKTDRDAYRQMIRGKVILELFPDHQMAVGIYRRAAEMASDDPYLYQQHGIYEMNRANGNLQVAHDLLTRAKEMAPRDTTIVHSLAELELIRAERAGTRLERDHFRNEAIRLANSIRDDVSSGSYAFHTLLKASVGKLRDVLAETDARSEDVEAAIRECEDYIEVAGQKYPGNEFLLTAEADFAAIIHNDERAISALRRAFSANARSPFIAIRLAKGLEDRGQVENGLAVLRESVKENAGDKRLRYALAMFLRSHYPAEREEIIQHLRRAYTRGDTNYEAQFWHAVYLFESTSPDSRREAKEMFRQLRAAPVLRDTRMRIRCVSTVEGEPAVLRGTVRRLTPTYGFIEREGDREEVFVHEANVDPLVWTTLRVGSRVEFHVGLQYGGPTALEMRIVG